MEKKLRVTLPEYIYKTIEADIEEFKINKNYILNYIYENLKFEQFLEDGKFDGEKTVIQFNLNKKNRENYYNFLEENGIQVEASFFRKLFIKYANQSKVKRELFIFKEVVERINLGIKENKILNITFMDKKETKIEPYYIGNSKLEIANYIFCFDLLEDEFKNYKLNNIKNIYINNKIFTVRDLDFIEKVKNNFDPFLSQDKIIKVRLTPNGELLFKNIKINRAEILSINKDIYELQCSEEKAKRYFSYFLDDVEILEPLELREWFINKYVSALKKYQNLLNN
ncbi:MAG: WYL domain-containing protein [Cetobacterium sp.]|uniref:WYL domain-containing protein n=1 Tax=Cetobacterium sp. TaxID=2071632 RepID=UPI002FCBD7BD